MSLLLENLKKGIIFCRIVQRESRAMFELIKSNDIKYSAVLNPANVSSVEH